MIQQQFYYLYNSYYYKDNKEYKNRDAYIRFYGNGRFKSQGLKEFPKLEDINDPESGMVGCHA